MGGQEDTPTTAGPSGRAINYSRWDALEAEEEREEDPMEMPVCSEIPWHHMEPLVNRILDEEYGFGAPTYSPPTAEAAKPPHASDPGGGGHGGVKSASGAAPQAPQASRPQASRAEALKEAGTEAFRGRDYDAALAAWAEAEKCALAEGNTALWAAARANTVLAELKRERWAAVEELATGLLERAPQHEKGLFRRGTAREARRDLQGARRDFMAGAIANFMNTEAQDALARVEKRIAEEAVS